MFLWLKIYKNVSNVFIVFDKKKNNFIISLNVYIKYIYVGL